MSQVVFFDLPSRAPTKAWSLNPWKTRMVLNYKGIDYQTEWINYPDLEPTFKSLGVPPNDPNAPGFFTEYSSPALRFSDGSIRMDSWVIAHLLEKQYPEKSLHLDDPIVVQIRDHIPKIMKHLSTIVIPNVPRNLLQERCAEYFNRTRKLRFGMPLDEYEKSKDPEQLWKDVEEPAKEAADLLKKHGGPFFLGSTVSYADFIFVSFLHFLKRADQAIFDRFVGLDDAFKTQYDASKEWLKKDD